MVFEVKTKKSAFKFILSLNNKQKAWIEEAVLKLKEEPVPAGTYDVIKLGGYDSHYRIRVGQIRITYEVRWTEKLIIVHYIGWRGGAY
jgi:mRNA-degrading endonuclease RelE of RelBE toxin-antitoxin system